MNSHGWAQTALSIRDAMTRVFVLETGQAGESPAGLAGRQSELTAARTALRYWLEQARDMALEALAELPPEAPVPSEGDPPCAT